VNESICRLTCCATALSELAYGTTGCTASMLKRIALVRVAARCYLEAGVQGASRPRAGLSPPDQINVFGL
jgi:hypothetical protein